MTALFLIWFGVVSLFLLLGIAIGMCVAEWLNDHRPEQPADADTARLDVWA